MKINFKKERTKNYILILKFKFKQLKILYYLFRWKRNGKKREHLETRTYGMKFFKNRKENGLRT